MSEHEQAVHAMERELDTLHGDLRTLESWTLEEVAEYDWLARQLAARCETWAEAL